MWGLSYKGELYKYDGGELIPIERKGNAFVLSKYMEDINRRNRAIFWNSFAFGATGGIITYSYTQVHTATAMPAIIRLGPEATALDVESGDLVF